MQGLNCQVRRNQKNMNKEFGIKHCYPNAFRPALALARLRSQLGYMMPNANATHLKSLLFFSFAKKQKP